MPAISGMGSILKACHEYHVKRLIVCSSSLTLTGILDAKKENDVYDEKDYATLSDKMDFYMRSKILQEQEVKNYLKEQKRRADGSLLEIITLHPPMVLGPTLIPERKSTPEAIRKIMSGKIPGVPKMMLPYVDIRDLGEAFIKSIELENVVYERFVISKDSIWMSEML